MAKKFFTKVSPRAAKGIKRVYEAKGYEVHAKMGANGSMTVVAVDRKSGKLSAESADRRKLTAA